MNSQRVELYIYDLSMGMAAVLSPWLGKKIDGIWHTSIVVYNIEFFFSSQGVECCHPGSTDPEPPKEIKYLGDTEVPYSILINYLKRLSQTSFTGKAYQLFTHNCNTFSEELSQFLCGASIPKYILELPNEVRSVSFEGVIDAIGSQLEKILSF